MDRIGDVDLVSQTVTVQAGVRGDRLEEALAGHGLTTGHYPQSIAISTVGGWIAASSAGQASTGFGAIEDMLLGLTAVLPHGRDPALPGRAALGRRAGPAAAPGRVRGHARRGHRGDAGLPGPPGGLGVAGRRLSRTSPPWPTALRQVRRAGTGAAVLRGYDETDAQFSFGSLGPPWRVRGAGRLPGRPAGSGGQEAGGRRAILGNGAGTDLGAGYGAHWEQHRNDAVQTYAQVMGPERAFGAGAIVDTMEVAGLWSAVPAAVPGDTAGPGRARAGRRLPPVPPVPVRLLAVLHVPDQRRRRPGRRDQVPAAWDQAARELRRGGRHDHPPSRRRAAEGALPRGRARRGGSRRAGRIRAALDPAGIMNPRT